MTFNPKTCIKLEDGSVVERDVFSISQIIAERWPELRIMYLDPSRVAEVNDPPYKIVEKCKDGNYREVMRVWQLDYSVIRRLELADTHSVDVEALLDGLVAKEQAKTKAKYSEANEQIKDIAVSALTTPKKKYTFKTENGRLVTIEN